MRSSHSLISRIHTLSILFLIRFIILPFDAVHILRFACQFCMPKSSPCSVAITFTNNRSAPCSAVLRHSPSSWAPVVHWSTLIPKALRSSRKHPIHFSFLCPPAQPAQSAPSGQRTSRTPAVSCPSCAPQSRKEDPPPAHYRLDSLASRFHERVQIGNRLVDVIILSPTDTASQETVMGSAKYVVVAHTRGLHAAQSYSIGSNTSAFSI